MCDAKGKLLIITGPTAVGKSDLSIKLAKALDGEIISADSCQVYKGMDIGSAKIMDSQMHGVKHHLIDVLMPNEEFNVAIFKEMASQCIEDIYSRNKLPIIVGGTGFYIQSILYDINFKGEDDDSVVRQELCDYYEKHGEEKLFQLLKECDEESAKIIHPNNVKRVIRAIEYYRIHNQKISSHNEVEKNKTSQYDSLYIVLTMSRDILYDRINKRVDIMFEQGLVDEVKTLAKKGYGVLCNSMQAIGYKEVLSYLNDEISFDECKELIKKNTRHFAKRQLTWFKREKNVRYIDKTQYENEDEIVDEIMRQI